MTAGPPRLFTVPDGDGPAVSLVKDAGAVELQPAVVEATPVDTPAPPGEGWRAERASRLAAAPAVLPAWLRSRTQLADAAAFTGRYYGHMWAAHGLRVPVYAARLWGRSPRGAAKLGGRWYRWVTDADARPVVSKAAAGDVDQWMRLAAVQTNRTNARRKASLIVGVPVALAVYVVAFTLPAWALAAAAAGIVSVLGVCGLDSDRPIVHRYVAVRLQRRPDSAEIEEALEAIKVKGPIDFVNPIAVDGPGWRADVDLPKGFLADDVIEKRAQLAAAMRRPLGCVWPEPDRAAHPGRLQLWIAREDPAKAKRRLWPLMKAGQADLFEAIPFGFDPRGRLVTLELIGTNVLIGGVMGSGKTSAVLAIALAGALDPSCEMHIYELKGSGDLGAVEPVAHRYVSGDDDEHCEAALHGLRWLKEELKRRKAVVKDLPLADVPDGRKVSARLAARRDLGLHPILAIFDEAHTLFEHEEFGDLAARDAADLIRKARAYGIIVIFTTQRPDAGSIPKAVSDNAILRFCLAVTGHQANNMILGSGAYARGVRATMFDPQHDAGTGWLSRSALSSQIVRAAYIKQGEAQAVGQRALALRIAAGTLTGEAAGERAAEVDRSTLIDHVRAVWPLGDDAVHSWRLVAALAVYRPELYGDWLPDGLDGLGEDEQRAARSNASTMLQAALKVHGVVTRQINRRGKGGGGKGVRWDDLPPP